MSRFVLKDKTFENIKYEISHSDTNLSYDNHSLGEYFLDLIRLRHDLLHFSVLIQLEKQWEDEVSVANFLKMELENKILFKTPDIQFLRNNCHTMIDVSISRDIETTRKKKSEKYDPIVLFLKNLNIKSKFIHINCSISRKNVLTEVEKIKCYTDLDFPIHDFSTCLDLVERKMEIVRENINSEYFENLKLSNFSENLEQMGYVDDIDIDFDAFKNFNSKFNIESKILNSLEDQVNEDEMCSFLKKILEEKGPVYEKYKDLKCDSSNFKNAHERIKSKTKTMAIVSPKPSHHIVFPFEEDLAIVDEKKEQDQIKGFFFEMIKNKEKLTGSKELFLMEIGEQIGMMFDIKNPNKEYNESVFFDYFSNPDSSSLMQTYKKMMKLNQLIKMKENELDLPLKRYFAITKENYKEIKENAKIEYKEMCSVYKFDSRNFSFKEFLTQNDVVVTDDNWFETYAFKNKSIITILENRSENFKRVYKKTGISHKFHKEDLNKKFEETIHLKTEKNTEKFIETLMGESKSLKKTRYSDLVCEMSEIDDEYALKFKKEMTDSYMEKFNYISGCKSFEYLHKVKLISTQLMHFSMLEMKPGSFSTFTCGIPNFICVVAGCYNRLFSQLGKPFMCAFFTRNPDEYTDFFGKLYKTNLGNGLYFVSTNWRRLPTFKLLHLKDLFFSVISSTMNSFLTYPNFIAGILDDRINHQFATRTLVGCATNQKCTEFLVDVRYAYVSSYAKYTNIEKLLLEKFSPPYRTCLETWIVERLFTRLPLIHDSKSNIKLKSADYFSGKRTMNSMGVKFKMPSLWGNYMLNEINEFLDEAFIYVHTLKEPSNIYYENVKAMNTIIEFQEMYDSMTENRQKGIYKKTEELESFLLSDLKIGCFSACIIKSANRMYNKDDPFYKKIIHEINDEDIGELVSTKAVISDNDRKIKQVNEFTKRQLIKRKEKMLKFHPELINNELKTKYVMETKSTFYNDRKPRQKVFETTLNLLEINSDLKKTMNLANYFVSTENGKVTADICIKSQYGSKREFYVINMGAKALARCTENFFKKICTKNGHEAISIPGDYKMLKMQDMIDRMYTNDKVKTTSKLVYVNGDCTKWSAAETMASFISLIIPLKTKIPEKMYNLLLSTYNSWSNKSIQIPLDIINNFIIPAQRDQDTKKYEMIRRSILENNGKFKSTQNFLQGMYNYASSYKAVCCSNYTYYIWKKIYPKSTILLEHMEHSDDYVLVVMTESYKEFEKFRVLHRIMMRFHGFNDSDKKTNCQIFMMEFVSLISFNGVMLYPQIKKTKEVNTNLPCTGYKSDIEASYSRIGEAMRMGCNQTFLYFMSKWQNICVAEAYSLLPGMRNSYCNEFKQMLNKPIELFGLIDMLPLFSLYCKGNGNNYRLYNYGTEESKRTLKYLLVKANELQIIEGTLSENNDYLYSLFNPKFIYERSNNSLVKIRRKLKWNPDDVVKFWSENIAYKFMKPRSTIKLVKWLKSMFYNRTFTEAYSKSSRTKMTMRISHFIRNPIISLNIDPQKFKEKYPEKNTTLMTMRQFTEYVEEDIKDYPLDWSEEKELSLSRIMTKCDPTFSAIYEYLRNIKITDILPIVSSNRPQISIKTPKKITSVNIVNSPVSIIQYMYNYSNFLEDKRRIVSEYSLLKDIETIKSAFLTKEDELSTNTMQLLSLYNNLMILNEKEIVCIGFTRKSETLKDQIGDLFRYNYLPHVTCEIKFSDVITIKDPVTGKIMYTRGHKIMPSIIQQSLENIALLHAYLTLKTNRYTRRKRLEILNNFIFTDPLNKTEKTFQEIITHVTVNNLNIFKFDLNTRKILGFFRSVYLGENDVLEDIVSNYYSYSYTFEKMALKTTDGWRGETIGTFKHIDSIISFTNLDSPLNEKIILMSDNPNYQMLTLHYNVALRLTDKIKERRFLENPTRIKVKPIKLFNTIKEAKSFFNVKGIKGLYRLNPSKKIQFVHVSDFQLNQEYLPLMKINKQYQMTKYNRGKLRPNYLRVDENKLMVFLGNYKLFTLPILSCRQFSNTKYIGEEMVYKKMCYNNNLYNYFHNLPLYTSKDPFNLTVEEIKFEIGNQKLYNIYDNDMTNYILKGHENDWSRNILLTESGLIKYFIEQGLLKKKKEKDEIKIDLKDMSKMMDFLEDDFLIPLEDEDDDVLGLDLDNNNEFGYFTSEKELSKLHENIGTDFLIMPNLNKKKLKRNFIIGKLSSLPRFELEYNRNIMLKTSDNKRMNLYALIENLKKAFSNFEKIKDKNIMYDIYELLCKTFVKYHSRKTIHQYMIVSNTITFTTGIVIPNKKEYLIKIRNTKNVRNIKISDLFIKCDIIYNVKTAMKKYKENCRSKIARFRKDKYIKTRLLYNEEDVEELFLDLLS